MHSSSFPTILVVSLFLLTIFSGVLGPLFLPFGDLAVFVLVFTFREWLGWKYAGLGVTLMLLFTGYIWIVNGQGALSIVDSEIRFLWKNFGSQMNVDFAFFQSSLVLFAIMATITLYTITVLLISKFLRTQIRRRIGESLPH